MKKRIPVIIVIVIAAIILAVAGWFMARDAAYARGKKGRIPYWLFDWLYRRPAWNPE